MNSQVEGDRRLADEGGALSLELEGQAGPTRWVVSPGLPS